MPRDVFSTSAEGDANVRSRYEIVSTEGSVTPAGPTRANAEVGSRIKMAKLPIQKSTMAGVMLYYSSLPPLPVQLDLSHLPLAPFSTNFDLGPVTAQVNSQAGDAVSVLPS